jgi:N-acetylmuramoyl-L-alanine amidase
MSKIKSFSPKGQNMFKRISSTTNSDSNNIGRNLFIINIAIIFVVSLVVVSSRADSTVSSAQEVAYRQRSSTVANAVNPMDEVSSVDVAVNIANIANLQQVTAIKNKADTIDAGINLVSADTNVIAKPQVVETEAVSKQDVVKYVVKEDDTLESVAKAFQISADAIRWSNDFTNDELEVGFEIVLPPRGFDGFVYQVKEGDTPESLANRFNSDEKAIVGLNDAEISGLKQGENIIIPGSRRQNNAVQATAVNNTATEGPTRTPIAFNATYGGNSYDYGYCTYWAAMRRAQVGKPIPGNLGNAISWASLAGQAGYTVNNTPSTHAVIWFPPSHAWGHVGFVEELRPDGSIRISEMNAAGWGRVTESVLTPAQAAGYRFIH